MKNIRTLSGLLASLAATTLLAHAAPAEPVKVFILAGQSNMVGLGRVGPESTPGTVGYLIANDPKYAFLGDGEGGFRVFEDVWIRERMNSGGLLTTGFGGSTTMIGPEMGFAQVISGLYDEQVLLIKTAWGNRDLDYDFRPPSSDPFTGNLRANPPGWAYQEMLEIIDDVFENLETYFPDYGGGGYEIAGFAWHQGWNDRISSERSANYETNMANFINDVRDDLGVPDLPFVIASSGMDSWITYTQVERAQLKMADPDAYPEFVGNVASIDTRQLYNGLRFWIPASESPTSEGFHWNQNAKTYTNIGLAMGDAMSLMLSPRCPFRLQATGDAAGVSLTWEPGTETPDSIQILRDGIEIATLPGTATEFLDETAEPGEIAYQLNFTMPGDPCPPLTLTYQADITGLTARRTQNNVLLEWDNNLGYDGIEVRRDGAVLASALPGDSTSYVDAGPPVAGEATYLVVATNDGAEPIETTINLDGLSPGNSIIYEGFDMEVGSLGGAPAGAGLSGLWGGSLDVAPGSMSFGDLPTSGNQTFNSGSNTTIGAVLQPDLAEAGLLDDGAELWFSFLTNNTAGTNTAVVFGLGTDRVGFFSGVEDDGQAIGVNISGGSSPRAATWSPTRSQASGSASIPSDTTALIVGKITWGADASSPDTLELYLPDTDLVLPESPVSTTSAVLDQSQFNVLSIGGKDSGSPKIDEIRFAASYDDVIALDQQVPDADPPMPNPLTWESVPAASGSATISMTATTAVDPSGVEYYFEETSGNPGSSDSGWQDSPTYTDVGLEGDTQYTYRVRARDKSPNQNTGDWSVDASATTGPPDTTPPSPDPMTFASPPAAAGPDAITMVATTATDESGVEYLFANITLGTDSGWQADPVFTDTGLEPETEYTYQVKARDLAANQNETAFSEPASATTSPAPVGPSGAVIYEPFGQAPGNLSGAESGSGLSGNWSATTGGNAVTIVEPPTLSYGGFSQLGGQADVPSSASTWASVPISSALADAGLLSNGATLWFSYVFQKTSGGGSNEHSGFAFGTARVDPAFNGLNMQDSGSGLGVFNRNTSLTASSWSDGSRTAGSGSVSVEYSEPVLVIGKIEWGATAVDDETLTVWTRALDDIDTEPTSGGSTRTTAALDQSAFTTISFGQRNSGGVHIYDEIRFGATFEDVTPQAISGPGPFETWAAGPWAGTLTDADPTLDFDGGGLATALEWVLGGDPTDAADDAGIMPTIDSTSDPDGKLLFVFRRNAAAAADPDTTILVEYGNDLAGWTAATHEGNGPDDITITEVADGFGTGIDQVTVALPTSLTSTGRLFARLSVEVDTPQD